MFRRGKSDCEQYREHYPGKKDIRSARDNVLFYSNKIRSSPEGDFIENIHKNWWGNYNLLESHHGYIQWLFPIREDGLNFHAQQLQLHEAEAIKNDPVMSRRICTSYELMLDFYGMKVADRSSWKLGRTDNWRSRYQHLNRSFHNYLRITRILKCLGEVGFEHLKMPFVDHILTEIIEHGELKNCLESCSKYWSQTLRNDQERYEAEKRIKEYENASRRTTSSRWGTFAWDEDTHVAKVPRKDPANSKLNTIDNYMKKDNSKDNHDNHFKQSNENEFMDDTSKPELMNNGKAMGNQDINTATSSTEAAQSQPEEDQFKDANSTKQDGV